MRVATLILGLVGTAVLAVQSVLALLLGSAGSDSHMATDGAAGLVLALLFLIGSALGFGVPRGALIVFGLAGVLAIVATTGAVSMLIWSAVAFVLAGTSYLGMRERRARSHTILPPHVVSKTDV